jgi:hypothetical protein
MKSLYNEYTDPIKKEMAKYGKLHGEAWKHRMNKEFDLMKEKQNEAKLALKKAKANAYIINFIFGS